MLGLNEEPFSANKRPESDTEDILAWVFGRPAREPVNGVKEARFDEVGPELKDDTALDKSSELGRAALCLRFSVWSRIRPRLAGR